MYVKDLFLSVSLWHTIQHNTALTRLHPVTIYMNELQQDTNFNKCFVWMMLTIKMKEDGDRGREK
jgi:hypothetical protein